MSAQADRIIKAIRLLRPGAQFSFHLGAEDISGLTWLDGQQAAPTQAEIDAAVVPEEWRDAVMADYRARRDVYLDRLAGIALFDGELDASIRTAAKNFRQRLLDLPAAPELAAATTQDELQTAIVTLYRVAAAEAVTTAPAGKSAFDKVSK